MELHERMVLTKEGQVTWANPELGKKCYECAHSARHPKDSSKHECKLVKLITKRTGKPYDAYRAIACSKFEVVDKPTSS